jgi:ACS family glucarate transporter-like MFS transporter
MSQGALVLVGANAVTAIISYLLIVGTIQRIELSDGEDDVPVGAAARNE